MEFDPESSAAQILRRASSSGKEGVTEVHPKDLKRYEIVERFAVPQGF